MNQKQNDALYWGWSWRKMTNKSSLLNLFKCLLKKYFFHFSEIWVASTDKREPGVQTENIGSVMQKLFGSWKRQAKERRAQGIPGWRVGSRKADELLFLSEIYRPEPHSAAWEMPTLKLLHEILMYKIHKVRPCIYIIRQVHRNCTTELSLYDNSSLFEFIPRWVNITLSNK